MITKHYKNMHGTMPQGLLKRFEVLKKCRNKFDSSVFAMLAFYKSFKAKSQRAIRLHSCQSTFIISAPSYVNSTRQNRFKCCNLHDLIHIFLDNGVMTTPKRRILSFVFTVFTLSYSLWKLEDFCTDILKRLLPSETLPVFDLDLLVNASEKRNETKVSGNIIRQT